MSYTHLRLVSSYFRMKPFLAATIFIVALAACASGQQPCPAVSVSCASPCPKPTEDTVFKATIHGRDSGTATFKWSLSSGRITSGQSTDTITARIDKPCDTLTGTVEVRTGPGCVATASCSNGIDCCGFAPPPQRFDEFGDVSCKREKDHLDRFWTQLTYQPGARGLVVFYGGGSYRGRLPRRGESEERARRIKEYLVTKHGSDNGRIVMMNGGFREKWIAELWIVPPGAVPPKLSPTLDPKDIKFREGKVKKGEYDCQPF